MQRHQEVALEVQTRLNDWAKEASEGENRETAVERMINCQVNKSAALDLSNLNLKNLPDIFVYQLFGGIETINLSGNLMTQIPQSLKLLAQKRTVFTSVKHVRFADIIKVTLIPDRNELKKEDNEENTLWWNNEDYTEFKENSGKQVFRYANLFVDSRIIDKKERLKIALQELYQPDKGKNNKTQLPFTDSCVLSPRCS